MDEVPVRIGRTFWARSGATGEWFKYTRHWKGEEIDTSGTRSTRACDWIDRVVEKYRGKGRAENISMVRACIWEKGGLKW